MAVDTDMTFLQLAAGYMLLLLQLAPVNMNLPPVRGRLLPVPLGRDEGLRQGEGGPSQGNLTVNPDD